MHVVVYTSNMHVVVVDAQNLICKTCFMRDNLKGVQYIDEYTVTMHWYIMYINSTSKF